MTVVVASWIFESHDAWSLKVPRMVATSPTTSVGFSVNLMPSDWRSHGGGPQPAAKGTASSRIERRASTSNPGFFDKLSRRPNQGLDDAGLTRGVGRFL